MISAENDGWPKLRLAVFQRDRGCIAVQNEVFGPDAAQDICRDTFGHPIGWSDFSRLEFEHVKQDLRGGLKAENDEAHGVAACPWHHRLGRAWRIDSREHRFKVRDYLRAFYPEVWAA